MGNIKMQNEGRTRYESIFKHIHIYICIIEILLCYFVSETRNVNKGVGGLINKEECNPSISPPLKQIRRKIKSEM